MAARKCLWVGGPPGQTLVKIKRQLKEQLDIDIVEQFDKGKTVKNIPSGVDLVLINTDMVDHGLSRSASAAAKKQNVDWCYAALSTVTTKVNLEKKGLLDKKYPTQALWVGGPGDLGQIGSTLNKMTGIEIVRQIEYGNVGSIPSECDLVLINVDMNSERLAKSAVSAAKKAGIPWCYSTMKATKTVQNLKTKGLVGDPQPTATEPEPAATEVDDGESEDFEDEDTGPTGEGWTMFEDGGVIYIHRPDTKGRMRRIRPVLIGEEVYASQKMAAKYLDVSPSAITRAMEEGVFHGMPIGLPCADEVRQAYPEITIDRALLGLAPEPDPEPEPPPPERPPEPPKLELVPEPPPVPISPLILPEDEEDADFDEVDGEADFDPEVDPYMDEDMEDLPEDTLDEAVLSGSERFDPQLEDPSAAYAFTPEPEEPDMKTDAVLKKILKLTRSENKDPEAKLAAIQAFIELVLDEED